MCFKKCHQLQLLQDTGFSLFLSACGSKGQLPASSGAWGAWLMGSVCARHLEGFFPRKVGRLLSAALLETSVSLQTFSVLQ